MAKRTKSWRDCEHCGKNVTGPRGSDPGRYYYPVPELKGVRLRTMTGVLVHHRCKDEYFKPDSD